MDRSPSERSDVYNMRSTVYNDPMGRSCHHGMQPVYRPDGPVDPGDDNERDRERESSSHSSEMKITKGVVTKHKRHMEQY